MGDDQQKHLGLEIGLIALAILLAILGLYLYVRFSPAEQIPSEYFFKVREPKIRERREREAKAAKEKETLVAL